MGYFLALFVFLSVSLFAKDLGTYGTTFPIIEEDFLKTLQKRLEKASFDKNKMEEIQQKFVQKIQNPKGTILPKALNLRVFKYDPTLYVNENITDHEGKIIISKGTALNPFDNSEMKENLLFFDGNDPQQVRWANSVEGKWILINGSPIDLEEKEKRAVYFDQGGYLSTKIGIRALPAEVKQIDNKFVVSEIPCP